MANIPLLEELDCYLNYCTLENDEKTLIIIIIGCVTCNHFSIISTVCSNSWRRIIGTILFTVFNVYRIFAAKRKLSKCRFRAVLFKFVPKKIMKALHEKGIKKKRSNFIFQIAFLFQVAPLPFPYTSKNNTTNNEF